MDRDTLKRLWRRVSPYAPLTLLGAACLVAAVCLSCGGPPSPRAERRPFTTDGVPILRVRLTGAPLAEARVAASGDWRLIADGQPVSAGRGASVSKLTRSGDRWRFVRFTGPAETLALIPDAGGRVRFNEGTYRGNLHFEPVAGGRFHVVNYVDAESYLAGVLAKELYPSWEPECFRALAIAARTFALMNRGKARNRPWDLNADTSSQVYGGVDGETDKAWDAVRSTHGQVLAYGPAGREKMFLPQYSSCCGGRTNPAEALRNAPDIPPLDGGVRCDDCRNSSRYRWGELRVPKSVIHRALRENYSAARRLRDVHHIDVTSRTRWGRPLWIDVVDSRSRTLRIRADDLRLVLLRRAPSYGRRLYSMNCRIVDGGSVIRFTDGRGWGHGVGLCQWGAQGKAVRGLTGEQILRAYYRKAKIVAAY